VSTLTHASIVKLAPPEASRFDGSATTKRPDGSNDADCVFAAAVAGMTLGPTFAVRAMLVGVPFSAFPLASRSGPLASSTRQ